MCLPDGIPNEVKRYYIECWDSTEKHLAVYFLQVHLDDPEWIEKGLWLVKTKYPIQGVSHEAATRIANKISRSHLNPNVPPDDISGTLHSIALAGAPRYELSLVSKFLHFCYPKVIPPFDQYAFTALSLTEDGLRNGLKYYNHPRNAESVKKWLLAFGSFFQRYAAICNQLLNEIRVPIPAPDLELAVNSITPYKVCDKLLWIWGMGGKGP